MEVWRNKNQWTGAGDPVQWVSMSDITDDDWREITEAYREARPGSWPDRSLMFDEMARLYIAHLKKQATRTLGRAVMVVGDTAAVEVIIPSETAHDGAGLPIRHEDDAAPEAFPLPPWDQPECETSETEDDPR